MRRDLRGIILRRPIAEAQPHQHKHVVYGGAAGRQRRSHQAAYERRLKDFRGRRSGAPDSRGGSWSHSSDRHDNESLDRVAAALHLHNIEAIVVDSGEKARSVVLGLIPERAEVHSGKSKTLEDVDLYSELVESGRYDAVRPRLFAMDRQTQGPSLPSWRSPSPPSGQGRPR